MGVSPLFDTRGAFFFLKIFHQSLITGTEYKWSAYLFLHSLIAKDVRCLWVFQYSLMTLISVDDTSVFWRRLRIIVNYFVYYLFKFLPPNSEVLQVARTDEIFANGELFLRWKFCLIIVDDSLFLWRRFCLLWWTIHYVFEGGFSDHWTIHHFFFDGDFIDQLGWFIIFWVEIWLITYGCSSVLWRRFADHHRWFYHHSSMELSPSIVNDESSFLCWFLLLLMITVESSSVFWWGFYQ